VGIFQNFPKYLKYPNLEAKISFTQLFFLLLVAVIKNDGEDENLIYKYRGRLYLFRNNELKEHHLHLYYI